MVVSTQDMDTSAPPSARKGNEGAVLIMPRPSTAWQGAAALWITVAGWAAAAERRFGKSWVVTPDAVVTAERALQYTAPRGGTSVPTHPLRRFVPLVAVTAAKDARELAIRRRFRALDDNGPWAATPLRFVWQQHDIFAGPGAAFARSHGIPFVLFVHAPQVWEAERWGVRRPGWGKLIEKYSEGPQLREADIVACVSEEVADEVRRFGVRPDRIVVTPMSVDISRFSPSVTGDGVRERLKLDGAYVFGWTGSFRKFHGLDIALHAFAALHREAPDTRLLLVGDGAEKHAIQQLAAELDVGDAVVFPGAVSHLEIPQFVAAMDAAVVIARDGESFHYSPLKLREYMLCGKPVVVPAAGEMLRILRNGIDAVHYTPGNATDLNRAMALICHDRARAATIGAEGHHVMAEAGTWDVQLDRLMELVARS